MYSYSDPNELVASVHGQDFEERMRITDNSLSGQSNLYLTFFIRPGDTVEYLAPLGDFERALRPGRRVRNTSIFSVQIPIYQIGRYVLFHF